MTVTTNMTSMVEGRKLKEKTPPPDLEEEWIAIRAVAEAHRRVVEAQGTENARHARVMSRTIERAKKLRGEAEKKVLDEFQVQHAREMREMQRKASGVLREREEVLEEVVRQHKEETVEAMGRTQWVVGMQLALWGEYCAICRVRDGGWRMHDWRECAFAWEYERTQMRETIEGIRTSRADWERQGLVQRCHACPQTQEDCWLWSVKGSSKNPREAACRFRGVMIESVAAILVLGGKRVEAWEDRGGRLEGQAAEPGQEEGSKGRLGRRAVGRVWQRFGYIGLMDIEAVEVGQVGGEYVQALTQAGNGGSAAEKQETQVVVRKG